MRADLSIVIHSTPTYFGKDKSQAIVGMQMAFAPKGSMCMPPVFGRLPSISPSTCSPWYLVAFLVLMVVMHENVAQKVWWPGHGLNVRRTSTSPDCPANRRCRNRARHCMPHTQSGLLKPSVTYQTMTSAASAAMSGRRAVNMRIAHSAMAIASNTMNVSEGVAQRCDRTRLMYRPSRRAAEASTFDGGHGQQSAQRGVQPKACVGWM